MYAIGLCYWLRTSPIDILLTFVCTCKNLSKLGKARIGFSIIFFFNKLNFQSIASVHLKGCLLPLQVSIIGAKIWLKFLMNFVEKTLNTMKSSYLICIPSSLLIQNCFHLLWIHFNPSFETTNTKQINSFLRKLHFFRLINNFSFCRVSNTNFRCLKCSYLF